MLSVADKQKRLQAEIELRAAPDKLGFSLNPSGYKSFGSWFTSALSGRVLSEMADKMSVGPEDPLMKKWYMERGWVEFGRNQVEEELEKYKKIGEVRNFTEEEFKNIKELQRRTKIMDRDLAYVYDAKNGDLDAPIDKKGQSFNERWGVDPEDEAGVMDFLKVLKDNPAYGAGMFTAEVLKDLPLSVLAWAGLTAKGASGVSGMTKAVNTLNKIEPKILRGVTKVSTGVGAGSALGAAYEAAYTKIDQGEIKGKRVKAGASFGAAFGVLTGLGLLKSGSPTLAKTTDKTPTPPKALSDEKLLDSVTETVVEAPARKRMLDRVKEIADNPNKIFPDILDGEDYVLVNLATPEGKKLAKKYNWTGKNKDDTLKGFKGIKTIINPKIENGKPHIVVDNARTKVIFNRLKKNFAKHVGKDGNLRKVAPSEHVFLKSEDSFNTFLFAREKAKVVQNRAEAEFDAQGKKIDYTEADGREVELNELASNELRRVFDENNQTRINKSDQDLVDVKEAELIPENTEGLGMGIVDRLGAGADWLSRNPTIAWTGAVGAGAAAYAVTDKEEGDPLPNAGAALLAVGLGPKARKLIRGKPLNRIALSIKATVAKGLEVDANQAKAWEGSAQGITDDLSRLLDEVATKTGSTRDKVGSAFISYIESGRKNTAFMTPELKEVANRYIGLLNEIGEQAVASGLIKPQQKRNFSKLEFGKKNQDGTGAFLANYFPHLFLNLDKLTDDDLVKIYGKIDAMQTKERTMQGSLEELRKMIDDDDFDNPMKLITDPSQVLGVYAQAMTRAIIGRNAINAMRELDLTPNGKRPPNYKDFLEGKITDAIELEKMQAYATRKVTPAVVRKEELDAMKESGRYSQQELLHYEEFKHPALKGFMGHTNTKNILDDFFAVRNKEGIMSVPEKLLKFNNGLKRVFVFGSLFHAQALFLSSVYALGLTGAVRGTLPKVLGGSKGKLGTVEWFKLQLGTEEFYNLADVAVKHGLQVVNIKKSELVNPGKPDIDPILDALGPAGQMAKGAFGALDKVTWEWMHDRFKLAAYIRHKEKAMAKGLDEDTAGRRAAVFANDAFGSLDWNGFSTKLIEYAAANPTKFRGKLADYTSKFMPADKRRWLNLFMFAPDWTTSNIRIVGKTFSGAPEASKAFYKKVFEGKNWESDPKAQEILAAWQMYGSYTLRAGIYTSALWWAITSAFSDNEPTAEGLWDFWFGEDSGKLDLGNGEGMVISKQLAEPIHWIQHPQHTLSNKGAIIPKTALEAFYNKQWFSLKKGMPLGPRIIDEDGTNHMGKWILGKALPIGIKPLFDGDLSAEEKLQRTGLGLIGFPQYGKEPEKTKYY